MNIYTQNCVIRDKVIFLHHHLSRSPSEFLHQLGLFYTSSVSTVSTFLHLWSPFPPSINVKFPRPKPPPPSKDNPALGGITI